MKIKKVTCWVLKIPTSFPLRKEKYYLNGNYVEIETDNGLVGHALSAYPMQFSINDFINREVAPLLAGMDPMKHEDIRATMNLKLARKYYMGVYGNTASLIDIALWDIKGKATGQPIWKLLGGAHEKVPTYITFGLLQYSKEELVEVAKTLVGQGAIGLKMLVGAGSQPDNIYYGKPTENDILIDAERVHAVREAVGDKIAIMIDANNNPTYPQAFKLAKLVEDCNLTWFEDPLKQADPRLMAHLRKQTSVPLAAGSTATSNLMFYREYLLNESVDIIQPNVRDIGGYTGGLKAAALAEAFNVKMSMAGSWPHINMHLQAGVDNGGWVEMHWQAWHAVESLFEGTLSPVNGWLTMPEAPGLGFTPKSGIVSEFAVKE